MGSLRDRRFVARFPHASDNEVKKHRVFGHWCDATPGVRVAPHVERETDLCDDGAAMSLTRFASWPGGWDASFNEPYDK